MLPSSPSPCTWLSHAPSTTLDTTPHQHPAAFPFHSTPLPTCAAFRFRRLGFGISPSPGFPLRVSIPAYLTAAFPQPGTSGASQVLRRISSCMPQPEDSGGHPHPHPDGCFILASGTLKPSPSAIRISKLYQLSGHTVAPTAYRILCVRFTSFVRQHDTSGSAVGATLDTGGWLALPRSGLSPDKMRQAYLGAVTIRITRARRTFARRRGCGGYTAILIPSHAHTPFSTGPSCSVVSVPR